MKMIILTSASYGGVGIEGLFEISDESYTEIQSLRARVTEFKQQWSEITPHGGTGITSWGGGPFPEPPKVTEEERTRIRSLCAHRSDLVHQWHDAESKIRDIVQFGKEVPYEEIN